MSLTPDLVQSIAKLSKLSVDDAQLTKIQGELEKILLMIESMKAIDTQGIDPMIHSFDNTQRLREDVVSEVNSRDAYQTIAPSVGEGLYLVPKVIE